MTFCCPHTAEIQKPVVLAVNKIDNFEMRNDIYEFYQLGLGDPYPVSGSHGLGLGDVTDDAVNHFKALEHEERDMDASIKVSSSAVRMSKSVSSMPFWEKTV